MNKTRLDNVQIFLEDSNLNPVDFNSATLTLTIQIVNQKFANQRFVRSLEKINNVF